MHLCQIASFLFAIIDLYATSPLPPLETSSRGVPIFLLDSHFCEFTSFHFVNVTLLSITRFYEGFFRVPYETKVDIGIRNNRLKGDTYLAVVWSQDLGQCERKYSAILYYQIKINLST